MTFPHAVNSIILGGVAAIGGQLWAAGLYDDGQQAALVGASPGHPGRRPQPHGPRVS